MLPSGEGAVEDVGLHERRRVANAPSKMPRILVAIGVAREPGGDHAAKELVDRAARGRSCGRLVSIFSLPPCGLDCVRWRWSRIQPN